jgi:8-oxo-dGTP pyrophosphatase MutT (NUDIX family)
VIEREGRLLLAGHFDPVGLFFWTFPGGLLREGESPEACAVREAWEETGLDVSIERLLYHLEWELPVGCRTELYFLAHPRGGTLTGANDPHARNAEPHPLLWVPISELDELPFRPGELKIRLPFDAAHAFSGSPYPPIRFGD